MTVLTQQRKSAEGPPTTSTGGCDDKIYNSLIHSHLTAINLRMYAAQDTDHYLFFGECELTGRLQRLDFCYGMERVNK